MISRIKGIVVSKRPPHLEIDVNGMVYELLATIAAFEAVPNVGSQVELFTHFVVREDQHTLFAFVTELERKLFRALIKVNGVGPKSALAILSGIQALDLIDCIRLGDIVRLVKIPGIGKKTAERLLVEMRDKFDSAEFLATDPHTQVVAISGSNQALRDAVSGLLALGYSLKEANKAVAPFQNDAKSAEEIIKLALQGLVVNL